MAKQATPRVRRPAPKKQRITNMVSHQKGMAERFLKDLQLSGSVPKKMSGILTPRFGSYVMIWQYELNSLVGAAVVHINNIDNFISKVKASPEMFDFLRETEENDTGNEPDTV